jgi:ferritin-like metal-binding protein YciE
MRMQDFERVYMRTLRHVYDTEKQLLASVRAIANASADRTLVAVLGEIEAQSAQQIQRIEAIFRVLYLEPRGEPSWVATALLREAWEASTSKREGGTQGCAASLLAIKRYEITLYEALLRWSEQCHLDELLPDIRRSIAEELVQASVLSELAFENDTTERTTFAVAERGALH